MQVAGDAKVPPAIFFWITYFATARLFGLPPDDFWL